jgi:ubiquinone/menaquinone biosynthesis C-methylase UbiE
MQYSIDETNLGRQRLLAHLLDRATGPHLANLAPRACGRWLDIGCGLGETTKLLTRFMAIDGECIGLDSDLALIEIARRQDWVGRRVSFQQGDATDLPFDDKSFDFVFTRYCLMHLSSPVNAIRDMLRVTKPGGTVFAQEPDFDFYCCYPPSPSQDRYMALLAAVIPHPQIGRKLVHLFREAGARAPHARADIWIEYDGADCKQLIRMTVEAIGASLVSRGRLSETEFSDLLADFARVAADPSLVIITNPAISVWISV